MMSLQDVLEVVDQLSPEEKAKLREYLDDDNQIDLEMPMATRTPGLFTGIWMSDDFDDELPDSFWLGEE